MAIFILSLFPCRTMWSNLLFVLCFIRVLLDQKSIAAHRIKLKYYWNIPTFQCDPFKLDFAKLANKFNIIQNVNDRFRGKHIAILYDPGDFPAILTNKNQVRKPFLRNGGIPQAGNLTQHLQRFEQVVNELIPDGNNGGATDIVVIDFESWRPIFRQNFGTLLPYKELSIDYERQKHPLWPQFLIELEAMKNFEKYARLFMEETLMLAKKLRKNTRWGYYGYPLCYNKSPKNMQMNCPLEVVKENDRLRWLYDLTDNLLPSLYLNSHLNQQDKIELVEGRIKESQRIVKMVSNMMHQPKILPYFWYKYQDTNEFVSKDDLMNVISTLSQLDIDGLIIWGSSNDVNTKQKCLNLYQFIDNILGPIITMQNI